MIIGSKGEERTLYAKPALFLNNPVGLKKKVSKIDLSREVIIFHKIGDFDPDQVRYLCEQIAERIRELGSFTEKTRDQIFEKMERGDCLVLSSEMEVLFFACLYEAGGIYIIDNILLHRDCMRKMGDAFRRFLNFKAGKSGIRDFFGLAPKELMGSPQTFYNLLFATSGFDLWDPLKEEHRDLLELLRTHENLGELLEEAYWIFRYKINSA